MSEPSCSGCQQRDVLIATLREQVQALQQRVETLETRLGRNASNSSLPPSASPPAAPPPVVKKRTGRRRGGQPGHPGHSRQRLPAERVDHTIVLLPDRCPAAGSTVAPFAGTISESGGDDSRYRYHSDYTPAAGTGWLVAGGSGSGSGSGFASYSYAGSGGYSYGLLGVTVCGGRQESGGSNSGYDYTFDATQTSLGGGAWTYTGGRTDRWDGGASSQYQAAVTVTVSAWLFTGLSATVGVRESGSATSRYSGSVRSAWNPAGKWTATSGSSSGTGSGTDSRSAFVSGGSYSYAVSGGEVSGTGEVGFSQDTGYTYNRTGQLGSGGSWAYTGTRTTDVTAGGYTAYAGSGEFERGDAGGTLGGTISESGADRLGVGWQTTETVDGSGNWQVSGRTGLAVASGFHSLLTSLSAATSLFSA